MPPLPQQNDSFETSFGVCAQGPEPGGTYCAAQVGQRTGEFEECELPSVLQEVFLTPEALDPKTQRSYSK